MTEAEPYRSARTLTRSQTLALALLRGQPAMGAPAAGACRDLLRKLAGGWTAPGFALGRPGSSFISADEYLLLSALAWSQKRKLALASERGLARMLLACGDALASARIQLPLSPPMLKILHAQGWIEREGEPDAAQPLIRSFRSERNGSTAHRPNPSPNSVRARAIAFASGKPFVTTAEFFMIGV